MAFSSPASAEIGAEIAVLCRLALDALAHPLLLLRPDGTLLHANPAGLRSLGPGGVWQRNSHHHIHPRDPLLTGTFSAALQAAAAGQAQELCAAATTRSLAAIQRLPSGGAATLLMALPLPERGAADVIGFTQRHRLSDAEARVLEHLLQGHGAQQAAQAIGVSVSTVRSQVLSLRRKTGHRSVPALLAGLRGLPALIQNE